MGTNSKKDHEYLIDGYWVITRRWIDIGTVLHDEGGSFAYEEDYVRLGHLIPDWHDDAKCRGTEDPDRLFFGADDSSIKPPLTRAQVKQAKEVCNGCPVYRDCLTHAIMQKEEYGIWAGTTGRTRERIWWLASHDMVDLEQVIEDFCHGRGRIYERFLRRTA